ncbi:MAG: hypothetical protein JNM13_16545 [Hyphomicrobiaceae bacterium]|nr:hypothetical protein [Hyphomicrobiaceae bacterium]
MNPEPPTAGVAHIRREPVQTGSIAEKCHHGASGNPAETAICGDGLFVRLPSDKAGHQRRIRIMTSNINGLSSIEPFLTSQNLITMVRATSRGGFPVSNASNSGFSHLMD